MIAYQQMLNPKQWMLWRVGLVVAIIVVSLLVAALALAISKAQGALELYCLFGGWGLVAIIPLSVSGYIAWLW